MMKIWKGLFYCFWHSDKAPVQSAYQFFSAFVTTMRREWFGIDRLRLDKFLLLIRKVVNQMLACLKAAKWRSDLLQRYTSFLRDHVVLPADTLSAAGLAYHVGDILLDELRAVADGRAVPGPALAALLSPFAAALAGGDQAVLNRIGEGLFDSLLSELASPSEDSPYLTQLDVAALAAQLFELGAAPDTRARNRQVLYDLSNSLERLQRKRARVEAGAQAGPSSGEAPAAKGKKQKSKAATQAAAAADDEEEPQAVPAPEQAGAAAPGKKRKAADRDRAAPASAAKPQANGAPHPAALAPVDGGDTPSEKQLAKKKKKRQSDATPVAAEEAAVQPEEAAEAQPQAQPKQPKSALKASVREPTSGQKAALRASVGAIGALPDTAAAAATAAAPKSAKKAAKKAAASGSAAGTPQQGPQPGADGEADDRGPSAAAAATTPTAAKSAGKAAALGKRGAPGSVAKAARAAGGNEEPQANGAVGGKTPRQAQAPGSGSAPRPTTAKKGRVVINLKKNLYFEHGGPIPDPDVRTPPPARAKGGILKKTAKSCPPKMAPSQATLKPAEQQGPKGRVVPQKARRASAALFF
ncbi:hypothetical protein GPECTOR_25g300 [Gonium pectorale]|uniref:Uncharacterized protein n=1 Tax=Gonium pectorale TaxID=33097 RepID=A0A150GFV1_GONPE|nr:hypothetical protein GPECTOR_25g300 [Gonium pectorale]|eukprot:KXZ48718.1 hypothetical protein GPECTOR_25g300 [Gonium pectorale]